MSNSYCGQSVEIILERKNDANNIIIHYLSYLVETSGCYFI